MQVSLYHNNHKTLSKNINILTYIMQHIMLNIVPHVHGFMFSVLLLTSSMDTDNNDDVLVGDF